MAVGQAAADRFRLPHPSGEPVADLATVMARQGFEPEVRGDELVLQACPFEATARDDRDTVCGLHLGIAVGLVEGSSTTVEELVAKDPRRADCRLRLGARSGEDSSSPVLTLRGRPS